MKLINKIVIILYIICGGFWAIAQTLGSQVEKKTINMGEMDVFRVSISNLNGKNVQSAPKNELLPFHFEEISDSIVKNKDSYLRVIQFSVYEEGVFEIPPLEFKVDQKVYSTILYKITVVNAAKNDDKLTDIMSNKQVKLSFADYYELYKWYFLAIVLIIAIIFMVYIFMKYRAKAKDPATVLKRSTLKRLEDLEKKQYIENGNFRLFYVELLDIIRNFVTKQYSIDANILLTDDLVDAMKNTTKISPENEKILEEVLLRGDLAKFAKTYSTQETMKNDIDSIKKMVKKAYEDIELDNLRNGV